MISGVVSISHDEAAKSLTEAMAAIIRNFESVLADASQDLSVAVEVQRRSAELAAYVNAVKNRPSIPSLQSDGCTNNEPANKKITPQRHFVSTKNTVKRAPELSIRKPTDSEKRHLMECLDSQAAANFTELPPASLQEDVHS